MGLRFFDRLRMSGKTNVGADLQVRPPGIRGG